MVSWGFLLVVVRELFDMVPKGGVLVVQEVPETSEHDLWNTFKDILNLFIDPTCLKVCSTDYVEVPKVLPDGL